MRQNESRWLRPVSLFAIAFLGICSVACATTGERSSRSNDDDAEETGGSPGPGASVDADGDGLTDVEEAEVGTDPAKSDTDGDGWSDSAEVAGNVDPLSQKDMPYKGTWGIDACRFDVVSTGNNFGDIAEDFELTDQFNETVRLHDFCGKLVVLLELYWWCAPCIDTAKEMQAHYQKYKDKGFLPIGLVVEGLDDGPPTQAQLDIFAQTAGITYPLLLDDGGGVVKRYPDDKVSFKHIFIGPGAKLLDDIDYVKEQDIESRLP